MLIRQSEVTKSWWIDWDLPLPVGVSVGPFKNDLEAMRSACNVIRIHPPQLWDSTRLAWQLQLALDIVRIWRRKMDKQSEFRTPSLINSLRYHLGESVEIMDEWMKATMPDPRNSPPSSVQWEYADAMLMGLTALTHARSHTDPLGPWNFLTYPDFHNQIQDADSNEKRLLRNPEVSTVDLIVMEGGMAHRGYITNEYIWQNHVIAVIYLSCAALEDDAFYCLIDKLEVWEKKRHPRQQIF